MPPAKTLARFAGAVEQALGITVSIGLSCNKFLAKTASDLDKPRGYAVLGQQEAAAFLAPRPVSAIFGVGQVTQARLARDGYRTIADLQKADVGDLMRRYGEEGLRLSRLSRGIDTRPVSPDRETKSVSAETTFEDDIAEFRPLERRLWQLTEKVSARLKAARLAGATVTLKLKSADFQLRTRTRSLGTPTQLAATIFAAGRDLLTREVDGTAYRLIGIGVSALTDQPGTIDFIENRTAEAEAAVDKLRERFGRGAVIRGITLDEAEER
jgi:DNA polymerase-4